MDDNLSKEIENDVWNRYETNKPYTSRDLEGMTDPEYREVLAHSARIQRVHPENAMSNIYTKLGGGVYPYAAEHIGDLYHRSHQERFNTHYGMSLVREKTNKILDDLTRPYGFEREMRENIEAASGRDKSISWDTAVLLGKHYAHEHSRLPVYNYPAHLMTQATQHLGNMRFGATASLLQSIKSLVDPGGRPEPWQYNRYDDDERYHADKADYDVREEKLLGEWKDLHSRAASIDFLKSIGR